MGQRQKAVVSNPTGFKYANLVECEEAEDFHVVRPTVWPPQTIGRTDGSVNLQCELCGAWLVVYAGHATGTVPGVKVLVPELKAGLEAAAAPKRRGGRPRKVVAEVA